MDYPTCTDHPNSPDYRPDEFDAMGREIVGKALKAADTLDALLDEIDRVGIPTGCNGSWEDAMAELENILSTLRMSEAHLS